jgi:hypothetical protein
MSTINTRQDLEDSLMPLIRHGLHELLAAAQADRQLVSTKCTAGKQAALRKHQMWWPQYPLKALVSDVHPEHQILLHCQGCYHRW